ncbi:hypothetical protein ES319_D05G394200v1 [Gossypium barbadense]|uniref:Uncharacterized protein n=1 Tax=Gossypium barbadense TaxID=3634 RepID=A0A5J5RNJ4_GOSBA|nr:hypothetical protein ES319_D05G394200v1 [Gossypium barbadense]
MGVEVVDSGLAQLSIDKVTEVDKSFLHENGKLDKDPVYNNPIDVDSHSEEPDKEEKDGASDPDFRKDAVDEWPAPKQIHSFHFIRYRFYEDPAIKAKLDQADKEIQKWKKARFKLTDELKAKRAERSEMLSQVRALNVDFEQFKMILDEKKREIEPLQQALGKLRNNKDVDNRLSLCASEEELDFIIHSLQYRIQHESISLSEEKRILKAIKHLEGTREKVIANAAMRSKTQDSLGQKEDIQDQVKLMGVDLNGVRKEQHASRTIVHNAKLLAAQEDIRLLRSYQLWSRDGRIRNPDEKPLVAPEKPVDSETETILRPSVRQPKEEVKSGPQRDTKLVKKAPKDAQTIAMESNAAKLKELKELKREEEIAKAKQAMERKKKLAEKAVAKAARRAQMEAEKKLKEIICFLIWFHFIGY